jgi:ACS family glucarate transporter-like MFS transporter
MHATRVIGRTTRFRWVVLALIFLEYLVVCADRANIGVALPFIRKEFHMSNTEAGALASIFLFAYLDKCGRLSVDTSQFHRHARRR